MISCELRSGQVRLVSKNDREFALGIEPQRSAGETQVTERTRREMAAGLRGRRGQIEAEGARAAGFCRLRPGECAQRFRKKDGLRTGRVRPPSIAWAKRARSGALEKSPAWPAMPPITLAFSSCTSPWMTRWRKARSSSVGGMSERCAGGGLKQVAAMPSGPKISRRQKLSSGSSARRAERFAENDEADVAVLGALAGSGARAACDRRRGQVRRGCAPARRERT